MFKNNFKDFYSGRIALVTGASSGIGKAISLGLVSLGATVFGVSRSYKKLNVVVHDADGKEGRFIPCAADISSYDGCKNVFNSFSQQFSELDILVNNAGIGHFSPFEKMPPRDYQYILDTNLMAPIHITNLFLGLLKKSGKSRIINICSNGAFYGIPFRSIYCASKAGMRVWSQALSLEVSRFGIRVICVIPGSVQTNFFENSLEKAPEVHRLPGKIMTAEKFTDIILNSAIGKNGEVVISLPSRIILFISAIAPSVLKKIIKHATIKEEMHIYKDNFVTLQKE